MSNEINSQIFGFLAKFKSEGGWKDVADKEYGNNDGTLIAAEFRKFMKGEWNGEATLTDDIITKFWNSIDTTKGSSKIAGTNFYNSYALDNNEVNNLDKKLELYAQINEFIDNYVQIPAELSTMGAQWKKEVVAELTAIGEAIVTSKDAGNITDRLMQAYLGIQRTKTAEFCAYEIQNELANGALKDLSSYGIADDATLKGLIDNYIASIKDNEGIDTATIKSDLTSIINTYLQEAGLLQDAEGGYDIKSLGYSNDTLSPIQLAVVTKNIKEALSSEAENYEGFEADFNKAVQEFIDAKIAEGGTFAEIKDAAADFANSDAKKALDEKVAVVGLFKNIDSSKLDENKLYNAFVEKFGEDAAKTFMEEIEYGYHNSLVDSIVAKFQKGEFRTKEGEIDYDALFNEFINSFVKSNVSASSLSNTGLNAMYRGQLDIAEQNKDGKAYMQAAKDYCKAVEARGEEYKLAIKAVFGTENYSSKIDELKLPSAIKPVIEQLMAKVETITPKVDVADKSDVIIKNDEIQDLIAKNKKATPTFYVNDEGKVVFVNYANDRGAFDDEINSSLDKLFYGTTNKDGVKDGGIKQILEKQYETEIKSLNLTSTELENLFNQALFLAVSDTSVVKSMYESMSMEFLVEAVIENFSKILVKISNDENARKFLKTSNSNSILAGTSTYGVNNSDKVNKDAQGSLSKYYLQYSTAGNNDWIDLSLTKTENYGDYGSIILLNDSNCWENNAPNNAMKEMLGDYINNYSKYVSAEKIVELFKQAQETAIQNLLDSRDWVNPDGSKAYGYGEGSGHSYDTFSSEWYSVNSLLINIAYEFEKLISKEMLGV